MVVAAWAGIGRGDEHDVGGVGRFDIGATDGYLTIFERLAKSFQNVTRVFGEFVQEKDAVMS